MRAQVSLTVFCLLAAAATVSATLLHKSTVACEPSEVSPGIQATCYIYAFDATKYPTQNFDVTKDFVVEVKSLQPSVKAVVSPVVKTSDPTVAKFQISAASGTTLEVDVYTKDATGKDVELQGSGKKVYVLGHPVRLGALKCDKKVLELRGSVTCTAKAYGANDVPALVTKHNILFTEDRGHGQFHFMKGNQELVFKFSAPSSLPAASASNFFLRVSIVGNGDHMYSVRLPVAYPRLAPTSRSILQCVEGIPQLCVVSAHDDIGPVQLLPEDFAFAFTRGFNVSKKIEQRPYKGMKIQWKPTKGLKTAVSSRHLTFQMVDPDLVFEGELSVKVNATGGSLVGSPFAYRSGVPPSADEAFLRRCTKNILISHAKTECYIEVDDGLVADPSYFSVVSEFEGDISNLVYSRDNAEGSRKPRLTFTYTAPLVPARTEDHVYVTIQGESIQRAPYRMVVYPRKSSRPGEADGDEDTKPKQLLLGTFTFGGSMLIGAIIAWRMRHTPSSKADHKDDKKNEKDGGASGDEEMKDAPHATKTSSSPQLKKAA